MVDEEAHEPAADDLGEQHLDLGLGLREPGLDVGLDRCSCSPPLQQKSGRAPAFRNWPGGRNESCAVQISTASRLGGLRRALPVDPVIAPFGAQLAASASGLRASS